ncbi:hypothetical protein AB1Y20_003530 [Prymnesium parvum]|uniref:Uncharacterized protein n=1 Tax=Prymnesium parvum TaxID=97485 RepID=A0AB34J6W3_PRYPA
MYQTCGNVLPARLRSSIHSAHTQNPTLRRRGASPRRCSARVWPNSRFMSSRVYSAHAASSGTCRLQLNCSCGRLRW